MSDRRSDDNKVICPACNNEFSAIPVAVQDKIESLRQRLYYYQPTEFSPEGVTWEQRVKELDDLLASQNVAIADSECQLREELAALKQSQGGPVTQFRKKGCSDWYDGYPDNDDGGEPYEVRTLYTPTPTIPEGWQLLLAELLTVMEIPFDLRKRIKAILAAAPKLEGT